MVSTVINTLLLLPLPRSFLTPLLPYVLSDYPLLLPLMTTISVPVLLAQTSRIPLRLSIFPLFSSGLLSSGLLPQPLLPYFLYKMALYRRLFLPSYFWLYASLSLAIQPFHPKTRYFRLATFLIFSQYSIRCFFVLSLSAWLLRMVFFYGEFLFLPESAHRTFTQPYSCFLLPILTVF